MDEETRLVPPLDVSVPSELTAIEQMAERIVTALDLIASRLELEAPHPSTSRRVRGARTVPREFVISMIAAVEALPLLQSFRTFDATRARQVVEDEDALRVVSERVAMLEKRVKYTLEARWSRVVAEAMATYRIAMAYVQDSNDPELISHMENLRRQLARKTGPKRETKKKKRQ